jgi:hypothetical protein
MFLQVSLDGLHMAVDNQELKDKDARVLTVYPFWFWV